MARRRDDRLDASDPEYKLVVMGGDGEGVSSKDALTIPFVLDSRSFSRSDYDPTMDQSFLCRKRIDGQMAVLDILDTAGQNEFVALRDLWIRQAMGFLLVYSITGASTFQQLFKMFETIEILKHEELHKIAIVIAGTKCHLEEERAVPRERGRELVEDWKRRGISAAFYETSVVHEINNEECFFEVVRLLRANDDESDPRLSTTIWLKEAPSLDIFGNPKKYGGSGEPIVDANGHIVTSLSGALEKTPDLFPTVSRDSDTQLRETLREALDKLEKTSPRSPKRSLRGASDERRYLPQSAMALQSAAAGRSSLTETSGGSTIPGLRATAFERVNLVTEARKKREAYLRYRAELAQQIAEKRHLEACKMEAEQRQAAGDELRLESERKAMFQTHRREVLLESGQLNADAVLSTTIGTDTAVRKPETGVLNFGLDLRNSRADAMGDARLRATYCGAMTEERLRAAQMMRASVSDVDTDGKDEEMTAALSSRLGNLTFGSVLGAGNEATTLSALPAFVGSGGGMPTATSFLSGGAGVRVQNAEDSLSVSTQLTLSLSQSVRSLQQAVDCEKSRTNAHISAQSLEIEQLRRELTEQKRVSEESMKQMLDLQQQLTTKLMQQETRLQIVFARFAQIQQQSAARRLDEGRDNSQLFARQRPAVCDTPHTPATAVTSTTVAQSLQSSALPSALRQGFSRNVVQIDDRPIKPMPRERMLREYEVSAERAPTQRRLRTTSPKASRRIADRRMQVCTQLHFRRAQTQPVAVASGRSSGPPLPVASKLQTMSKFAAVKAMSGSLLECDTDTDSRVLQDSSDLLTPATQRPMAAAPLANIFLESESLLVSCSESEIEEDICGFVHSEMDAMEMERKHNGDAIDAETLQIAEQMASEVRIVLSDMQQTDAAAMDQTDAELVMEQLSQDGDELQQSEALSDVIVAECNNEVVHVCHELDIGGSDESLGDNDYSEERKTMSVDVQFLETTVTPPTEFLGAAVSDALMADLIAGDAANAAIWSQRVGSESVNAAENMDPNVDGLSDLNSEEFAGASAVDCVKQPSTEALAAAEESEEPTMSYSSDFEMIESLIEADAGGGPKHQIMTPARDFQETGTALLDATKKPVTGAYTQITETDKAKMQSLADSFDELQQWMKDFAPELATDAATCKQLPDTDVSSDSEVEALCRIQEETARLQALNS